MSECRQSETPSMMMMLAISRACYDRSKQTLALLEPPHASVTVASDGPSLPSAYPELAVRTIMDFQFRLLHSTVSDRYLQASASPPLRESETPTFMLISPKSQISMSLLCFIP